MMKLLLVCMAVALLAPEVELIRSSRRKRISVSVSFEDAGITPTIIPVAPKNLLLVYYDNTQVTPGITLNPEDTNCPLSIEYVDSEPGCYYTLIAFDADFPSPEDNYGSSLVLLLVVNISDVYNCFETGVVLAPYRPPLLSAGSDPKRIVFLLYEQTGKIDSASCIENSYNENRYQFDFASFASSNNLCREPNAGTFYYVQMSSDSVGETREVY